MKLADIEEGECYLIGSTRPQARIAKKVRVDEIAKMAKPGQYATSVKRRCRCTIIEDDGTEGEQRILGAQEILKPWSEAQAELDAEEAERQARKQAAEETTRRREEHHKRIQAHIERIKERDDIDLDLDAEDWNRSLGRGQTMFGIDLRGNVNVPSGLFIQILELIESS